MAGTTSSYPELNPGSSIHGDNTIHNGGLNSSSFNKNGLDNGTNTGSLNGNASSNTSPAGLKDAIYNNSRSAMDALSNNSTVQSLSQGPVAENVRAEANKTSNEFSNVAASRQVPDTKTATGQNLTHYHSMFFNILSWENPRVTGITYATVVTFIFFTRYVPILKYFFKASYTILGIIAAAEIAGKLVFDKGLATQIRPRKYYTIPRESLENALEDVEQFVNFFVIEAQRIVFAENVGATVIAFASALLAYFLIKFVPTWGIALIATSVVYFIPLIYIRNREVIDSHLNNAGNIINQQAVQARELAAQHTSRAGEAAKSTANQYAGIAQDYIGQAKSKAGYGDSTTTSSTSTTTSANKPVSSSIKDEFSSSPSAPRSSAPISDAFSSPSRLDGTSASARTDTFSSELRSDVLPSAPQHETFPSAPKTELEGFPSANANNFPIHEGRGAFAQ